MTTTKKTTVTADSMSRLLRTVAHPTRMTILKFIIQSNGAYVYEIIDYTGISQSVVSQHLTKLRALAIVKDERHGTKISYSVESEVAKEVIQLVSQYVEF